MLKIYKSSNIEIPTHTYLSVAFLGEKLGIKWIWKEEMAELLLHRKYKYYRCSCLLEKNSYIPKTMMCLSFQFQKHLNIGKGGMILT